MANFEAGDEVWVIADEEHELANGKYTLDAVDKQGGYIDHDGKTWHVPFEQLIPALPESEGIPITAADLVNSLVTSSLERLFPHSPSPIDIRIRVGIRFSSHFLDDGTADEVTEEIYKLFEREIRRRVKQHVLRTRQETGNHHESNTR